MNPVLRFWILYNIFSAAAMITGSIMFLNYIFPVFRQRPVASTYATATATDASESRRLQGPRVLFATHQQSTGEGWLDAG